MEQTSQGVSVVAVPRDGLTMVQRLWFALGLLAVGYILELVKDLFLMRAGF